MFKGYKKVNRIPFDKGEYENIFLIQGELSPFKPYDYLLTGRGAAW